MKKFKVWLAHSPLASALKIGVGAALVYIIDNAASFNLGPAWTAVVISIVTVLINFVNSEDNRYGVTNVSSK
jgi:hypothetical protein